MRRLLVLPLALLILAGCGDTQSPGELTLQTRSALDVLPADVEIVSMVNMERARDSDAFESVTGGSFSMQNMTGEGAARFNDFIEATGFNPDEDLQRVYFAAQREGEDAVPAFVVYANYDRGRLDAYVDEQPELEFERSTYADAPVYVHSKNDKEMAFALVNDEMIVAGPRDVVYGMLDRLASGTRGLSGNAGMMDLVGRAAFPDDMWVVIRDLSDVDVSNNDPLGQAGRMVENAVISAGFERDGISIEALGLIGSDADSGEMADLVRGAVAAMKMGAKSDPAALEALDRVDVREVRGGIEVETFVSQEALRSLRNDRDV